MEEAAKAQTDRAVPPAQTVECDACRQAFEPAAHVLVERDGTVGLYCPHCQTRFVSYRTNSLIRSMQAQVRKERELFRRKIASGVPARKAERKMKQALKKLEMAFRALNPD